MKNYYRLSRTQMRQEQYQKLFYGATNLIKEAGVALIIGTLLYAVVLLILLLQ